MKTLQAKFNQEIGRAILLVAVTLGLTGCVATQDYVKQEDAPILSRMARLEASAAQETTRLDQVVARVAQVSTQVTETRAVADGAVRAVVAVDARLISALNNRYKRELVDTVILFFKPGQSSLLPVHHDVLKGVLQVLAANPTYTVDIVGFTDSSGSGRGNLTLSWRREEAARRYLAMHGREMNRISFIGLGDNKALDEQNHPMMRAADRRLSILIYRPVR
jgi:outer membrane protein OmpA-like peptidoglycan-associated protein